MAFDDRARSRVQLAMPAMRPLCPAPSAPGAPMPAALGDHPAAGACQLDPGATSKADRDDRA